MVAPAAGSPPGWRWRGARYSATPSWAPSPATLAFAQLLRRIERGGLLGTRHHRRRAAEDEQVLAAVDSGQRGTRDAGENLPRVALERGDARDSQARRIGAVEPRGHEHVTDLD